MRTSLIIPTFNRPLILADLLKSIASQSDIEFSCVDIIVVDNGYEDSARMVTLHYGSLLPVKYVREHKSGASFARNSGIAASVGDLVFFIDDDIYLDQLWLHNLIEASKCHLDAAYFGARVLPDWDRESRPKWLLDEDLALIRGIVGKYDLGYETRYYRNTDTMPVGAACGFRRELFDQIGMFRTDMGPFGSALGRGEDTEVFMRARARGFRGIYVGNALCWHKVDPKRLTIGALYRCGVASGNAQKKIGMVRKKGSVIRATIFLMRGIIQLTKWRRDRFRQCIINAGIEIGLK